MQENNFAGFHIEYGSRSDQGLIRSENQDYYGKFPVDSDDLNYPNGQLFVIADGMGGYERGKEASESAVRTIQQVYFSAVSTHISHNLKNAFEVANRKIYNLANSGDESVKMGTTCTALVLSVNKAYIGHVGDCRVYRIDKNSIEQLTLDHTQAAEMYRKGILSQEEIKSHSSKSVLVRAFGVQEKVEIDIIEKIKLKQNEYYVLCSDGLREISKEEIKDIVINRSPQEACDDLIKMANDRGGHDNITVQVIKICRSEISDTSPKISKSKKFRKFWILWLILILFMLGLIWIGYQYNNVDFTESGESAKRKDFTDYTNDINSFSNFGDADLSAPEIKQLLNKAEKYFNSKKYNSAINVYRYILQRDPMNLSAVNGINDVAVAYMNIARNFQSNKDFQAAREYYSKALELQPNNQSIKESLNLLDSYRSNVSILVDSFSAESNTESAFSDWRFSGNSGKDYLRNNGEIIFLNNANFKRAVYQKELQDVMIEIRLQIKNKEKFRKAGLILGFQTDFRTSKEKFLRISVLNQETIELEEFNDTQFKKLATLNLPKDYKDSLQSFQLGVKCLGPWIMIYNNRKLLKAWFGDVIIKGKFGLFADPYSYVSFSQLQIKPAIENGISKGRQNDDQEN
jgi:serine/threonine protein phosphatase PrpC/tetratricopeptide (TPR) repeat protein